MAKEELKITTPEFRLCFPALYEPEIDRKTQKPGKFTLTAAFLKTTDLTELKKLLLTLVKQKEPKAFDAFLKAFKEQWPTLPEKIAGFGQPFRDGDTKSWDGFQNSVYIKAKSKFKPVVVGRDPKIAADPTTVYAGCYAKASISPFAYGSIDGGSPGFAFGLRNVQIIRDGEPLAGGGNAEDDFESLEDAPAASDSDLDGL